MHALTDAHWAIVKCILCYLKGMTSYDLHITCSSSFSLHGFTDANQAGNADDYKSTGAYLVYCGTTPIFWKLVKQRMIVCSSTGVEYKTQLT